MRKRMGDTPAVKAAQEFIIICHRLLEPARELRPASYWRLQQASHQIMHFVIHASSIRSRKGRAWRLEHAVRAGESARRCLNRIAVVEDHRVSCSACHDVLDRVMTELRSALEANEKAA